MMRIHESFLEHRKRVLILTAIGLILLGLVAGYVWTSYRTWQSSEQIYTTRKSEAAALATSVLYDSGISTADRQTKLKQLSVISSTDLCRVSTLYKWQRSFIGSLEVTIKECEAGRSLIETIVARASSLRRYNNDESIITQQLQKLKPSTEAITPAGTQKTLDTVEQAQSHIKGAMLATGEGKELRVLLNDVLTGVINSWAALNTASEKQDRTAYEAEVIKLAASYDRFDEISKFSSSSYQKLLVALQTASSPIID